MATRPDVAKLQAALAEYETWLMQVASSLAPGESASQFDSVVRQFREASSQVMTELPKELARMADIERETAKKLEESRARIDAMKPTPAAAAPLIDPFLSQKLRDELLEEFGTRPAHPPRRPVQPRVGDESFEWESTREWEKRGQ